MNLDKISPAILPTNEDSPTPNANTSTGYRNPRQTIGTASHTKSAMHRQA